MGVDRIVAYSEQDYTQKSVRHIAACIRRFLKTRHGSFVLGLSGTNGRVRRARAGDVFSELGRCEGIDWSRVIVFLVDERYGFDNEEDSNAHLVKTSLVQAIQEGKCQFPKENLVVPNTSLPSWEACARDYEAQMAALFARCGHPNLVTLGLASDLSVGSIFPEWYRQDPQRWSDTIAKRCGVLMTKTSRYEVPQRVCVNLRIVRQADNIVVFLGGKSAKEMLRDSSCANLSQDLTMLDRLSEETPSDALSGAAAAATPRRRRTGTDDAFKLHRGSSADELGLSSVPELDPQLIGCTAMAPSCTSPALGSKFMPENRQRSAVPMMQRARSQGLERTMSSERNDDLEAMPASPLSYVMTYSYVTVVHLHEDRENHHSIVVFGAAGDLAKKKTIPAIYHLYLSRTLPTNVSVVCCDDLAYHADIKHTDDLWSRRLEAFLQQEGGRPDDLRDFRQHVEFVPIKLDDPASMQALDARLRELSQGMKDNRVFYLAQPPFLFEKSVRAIRGQCWTEPAGCVRVIVEKPFGRDLASAQELSAKLSAHLAERQIFRIDHYLAKTMVLNILTLRFANRELGRLFHADNVANVRITFKEDIGVEGRAGYFNSYGIIRDIMQNHLLQLLTLVTMEAPASLTAEDVRNEKVKVLKQIRPVEMDDCAIGQYEGYQEDPDIQKVNAEKGYPSKCPTFATCVLYLDNERWSGVPLILKAAKNAETRSTIMRLQFKKAPPNSLFGDQPQNELVMRVQPNEAIYYRVLAKTPGISARAHEVRRTMLELDVRSLDEGRPPEAYEKLIHDVLKGESHNFVRSDEVEEGWRIFDPLLQHLESEDGPTPPTYPVGSRGPREADELINSTGFRRYTKTGVQGFAHTDFD